MRRAIELENQKKEEEGIDKLQVSSVASPTGRSVP
eukprot:COSAG02_NODE_1539_length_12040_cov_11.146470_3_plen_35_part_00